MNLRVLKLMKIFMDGFYTRKKKYLNKVEEPDMKKK